MFVFYQESDVIDGEALEDVCKARLEVDRLAAEHGDACNVACKCHKDITGRKSFRGALPTMPKMETRVTAMPSIQKLKDLHFFR